MNNSTFNTLIAALGTIMLGVFGLSVIIIWMTEHKAPLIAWLGFILTLMFAALIGAVIYSVNQPIK